jgi:hypothetical protein
MDTAILSSKGQLVIPKRVRALAHAHSGDAFYVQYVQGEIRRCAGQSLHPSQAQGARLGYAPIALNGSHHDRC